MICFMSDSFVEQMIKKKVTMDNYALRLVVVLLTITVSFVVALLSLLYMPAFMSLAITLFIIGICLLVYVIRRQRVEYEYEVTNDNITVDKIINKSRRLNVCSLTVSHITLFCHIDDKRLANRKFGKRFDVSTDINAPGNYVACFPTQKYGDCCLIFTPNDDVLEAVGKYLPREQRYEFREMMKAKRQKDGAEE